MADVKDRDQAFGVVDFIDDSKIADADSPAFASTKFLAARRSRIESQLGNGCFDLFINGFIEGLKLPLRALND